MSSTYAEPLDRLDAVVDELASIGPEFRSTGEKRELLLRISRVIGRAEAVRLRVLAASDDIAAETGDRSTAAWLATQTRTTTGPYVGMRRWRPHSAAGGRGPRMRSVPAMS